MKGNIFQTNVLMPVRLQMLLCFIQVELTGVDGFCELLLSLLRWSNRLCFGFLLTDNMLSSIFHTSVNSGTCLTSLLVHKDVLITELIPVIGDLQDWLCNDAHYLVSGRTGKGKRKNTTMCEKLGFFFSILRKVAVLITMFSSELTVDRPNTFH